MNKTRSQPVDARQVKRFLDDAAKRANTARRNLEIDSDTAFQIAYEAMIKASLALMLSHGQRPRKQLGHHMAIIEFAQKHLPSAPTGLFPLFDRMRRKRNDAFYDIAMLSESEAQDAVATADAYLRLVTAAVRKQTS